MKGYYATKIASCNNGHEPTGIKYYRNDTLFASLNTLFRAVEKDNEYYKNWPCACHIVIMEE